MKHIISITEIEKTWCGEPIFVTFGVPPFKCLDQAAFNGLFPSESNKPVCTDCIDLCVQSLLKNIEGNNEHKS